MRQRQRQDGIRQSFAHFTMSSFCYLPDVQLGSAAHRPAKTLVLTIPMFFLSVDILNTPMEMARMTLALMIPINGSE